MFSLLADKLQGVFRNLSGKGKISESNVTDALREVRMALLEADVHFQVAKDFIARVKEKALGEEVLKSVTPGQQIVKIFHDELTVLLGGDASELLLTPPARILMVGLNGAGKTTTCGKLANFLRKQGMRRCSSRWIFTGPRRSSNSRRSGGSCRCRCLCRRWARRMCSRWRSRRRRG